MIDFDKSVVLRETCQIGLGFGPSFSDWTFDRSI